MPLLRNLAIVAALALCGWAHATQQPVAIGSAPDDKTGDPVRTAFTKLNANDAELYAKFPVIVPNGGTGVTSISGVLKGNGSGPFMTATMADIIALAGGGCDISVPLRGDGSCGTVPAGSVTGLATSATVDTTDATNLQRGTLNAARLPASIAANTTGNAATATALAANPTDCSANQYASAIDAGGNLTCGQVGAAQVTGLAPVATSGSAADLNSGTLPAARLPATTVTAAAYGDGTHVGQFTVAADGRLTAAASTPIAIAAGAVSGLAPVATSGSATDLGAGTLSYARLPALVKPTTSTIAVGASITLPNPTSANQTTYVTGAAGTVLTTVTTAITMPATPVDQGTLVVGFDAAQVPSFTANTAQSFPTGSPSQLLMQPGGAIRFYYDGTGTRGTAGGWYWDLLTSADGGLYSSAGIYQSGTMAGHVQTLEGEVTTLQGTSGDIAVTGSTGGTVTFDTGASIPKLAANNNFSGSNTLSNPVNTIAAAAPHLYIEDTAQSGTNITDWDLNLVTGANGQICLSTRKDDLTGGNAVICGTRGASGTSTGAAVTNVTIGSASSSTTYTFPGGTATYSGTVKAPLLLVNGASLPSTSGQSGLYQPASNQIGFGGVPSGTATQYGYFDSTGSLVTNYMPVARGLPPVVSCSANCVAQNSGVGSTVTFTGGGSAVINGTSLTFAPDEVVTLTTSGSLPAAFNASSSVAATSLVASTVYVITALGSTDFTAVGAASNTLGLVFTATGAGTGSGTASTNPYYVNSTGIATTTLQLCSAAPTLGVNGSGVPTWTACTSLTAATTGSGTHTATGWNNYLSFGGLSRGVMQLPTGTWSGATTLKMAWPSDSTITNGILCQGNDLNAQTQLTNIGYSTTYSLLIKATAATSLDFWTYNCGGF